MPLPDWIQKHQTVVLGDRRWQTTPIQGSSSRFVLPICRFTVLEVFEDVVLVEIPGLLSQYQIDGRDLMTGWQPLPLDGIQIHMLTVGAKLQDKEGRKYILSALMGTEVVLRPKTPGSDQYLEPRVKRMSVEEALKTLTVEGVLLPNWLVVGAKVKRRNNSKVYVVRSISTTEKKMVVSPVDKPDQTSEYLFGGEEQFPPWSQHKDPEVQIPGPDWLKGQIYIRSRDTEHSFWVRDVNHQKGNARVQPVMWTHETIGESRTPTIADTWDTKLFADLSGFEVIDEHGFRDADRVCNQCSSRGKFIKTEDKVRTYRCENGHAWALIYDAEGNGRPVSSRFDLVDD